MIEGHARLDLAVFTKIAAVLNVTARYVGEEPASQVTGLYNQIMKEQLPKAGIHCIIVPRKQAGGKAISASERRLGVPESPRPRHDAGILPQPGGCPGAGTDPESGQCGALLRNSPEKKRQKTPEPVDRPVEHGIQ